MKEEEDRREDHQLLEVKTLTEEIIKMIKTNLTKVVEILNMKMVQKDSKQINRIIKVDIGNLNSHQDQLSLSYLCLSIQKRLNLKKSRSSPISSK